MRMVKLIDAAVAIKGAYASLIAACLLVCVFCGIEGGLQLHLSHDHPSFGCVALAMSEGAKSPAPPCTSPDVSGEPWRLRLVGLDLAGFLAFGMLWTTLRTARKLKYASARRTNDPLSEL